MSNTNESITLADGNYTVELGMHNGKFSFSALRNEPWRDMSSDGDGLMLAMFHRLLEQREHITQLELAAKAPIQRAMRRWDVEEGTTEPVEAEPRYMLTMDADRGLAEIRPAGVADDQVEGLPRMLLAVEIDRGVPRLHIYRDIISGDLESQRLAMPGDQLVHELHVAPDIQAIGEAIRSRTASVDESPFSSQAPRG